MSLTIGSLFSGIGGLELGLEWAGLGPTIWQVEQNPYCLSVLARHWPEANRHEDVCKVGAAQLVRVDVICGGFPCQDVSGAGKGAGLAGARSGLWYEFARVVDECSPRYVVVENVTSGAVRWVDAVRGDLERLGYATLPVPVSAADCGAPHRRARVFIVAAAADSVRIGRGAGLRSEPSRVEAQLAATLGVHSDAANSNGEFLRIESGGGSRSRQRSGPAITNRHRGWSTEPDVVRMVHGIPGRVDREKALGNAVMPVCAEVIGHVIQLMEASC